MSYIHLILFVVILVLKYKEQDIRKIKYVYAVCQFINFMLLLDGMAGLGETTRSNASDYNKCAYDQLTVDEMA
jgi:uncharacterized membrane protein SirB2